MANERTQEIKAHLAAVQERIDNAARRTGRDPKAITLVAVTKTWPVELLPDAHAAGIRIIGENRAEELAEKREFLAASYPELDDFAWHQIGTLQSRKTKLTAEYADYFHALDRLKVASRLSAQAETFGRDLPVLLEVNLSGELAKSGFLADKWEEDATQRADLRIIIQKVAAFSHLRLKGLMTMAPWNVDEALIRSVFQRTRMLRDWLQNELPGLALPELSMGMTDDFEIAIEEGATMVRIGRAIFGERH
ncbi:MAG: YggS family pyridoxal phosphate-dependent enzyme [Candidatus Promineifilaceae bacterium]